MEMPTIRELIDGCQEIESDIKKFQDAINALRPVTLYDEPIPRSFAQHENIAIRTLYNAYVSAQDALKEYADKVVNFPSEPKIVSAEPDRVYDDSTGIAVKCLAQFVNGRTINAVTVDDTPQQDITLHFTDGTALSMVTIGDDASYIDYTLKRNIFK